MRTKPTGEFKVVFTMIVQGCFHIDHVCNNLQGYHFYLLLYNNTLPQDLCGRQFESLSQLDTHIAGFGSEPEPEPEAYLSSRSIIYSHAAT